VTEQQAEGLRGDFHTPGTPPLRLLYVNPAGGCNLRCAHCWVSSPWSGNVFECRPRKEEEIDAQRLGEVLDEAIPLGLRGVKFTGGEPLSREDFPSLHRQATGRGLRVTLETNGTLDPPGLWEAFQERPPDFVALSLDFPGEEDHDRYRGVPGAWRRTVEFSRRLSRAGVPFQLVMSMDGPDLPRIREMAVLASSTGASSLAVNLVQPEGRARGRAVDRMPVGELLGFIRDIDRGFGPRVLPNAPPALLSLPRLVPLRTCPVLNLLGLMPDGSISFCGIAFTREELLMGDAREAGRLGSIWTSHPLVLRLREALLGPRAMPCGGCVFRRSCLGFCSMGNYSEGGDFSAPNWLCSRAWQEGLFPESRLLDGGRAAGETGSRE
jgi:AdoMet-dependent heme synthase